MRSSRTAGALIGASALLVSLSGCGSADDQSGRSGDGDADRAGEHEQAADVRTCAADAKALPTPYGGAFPDAWPFPPDTIVYDVEDRGDQGTIVTAVSKAPFKAILDFLNHQVADAGFVVESGETEDHDAEAEWAGNDHRGRWAIRESAHCPGETVIQVLAAETSG
jgi:uncharacterized lipoprotein